MSKTLGTITEITSLQDDDMYLLLQAPNSPPTKDPASWNAITPQNAAVYFGTAGANFEKVVDGKATMYAISGQASYASAAGSGTITIDNRESIKSAVIMVETADKAGGVINGDFSLAILDSAGEWNNSIADLWIPDIHIYDGGPTLIAQDKIIDQFHTANGLNNIPVDEFQFGSGTGTFVLKGTGRFGVLSRMFIVINFGS